jgi:hypothetical protein
MAQADKIGDADLYGLTSTYEVSGKRKVRQPDATFECIVDSLALANWRLRPGCDAPARVHLSCLRLSPTQADRERELRVNQSLDQLSA